MIAMLKGMEKGKKKHDTFNILITLSLFKPGFFSVFRMVNSCSVLQHAPVEDIRDRPSVHLSVSTVGHILTCKCLQSTWPVSLCKQESDLWPPGWEATCVDCVLFRSNRTSWAIGGKQSQWFSIIFTTLPPTKHKVCSQTRISHTL